MLASPSTSVRELDSRRTDGIQVDLLWDPTDNTTWVAVDDTKTGEAFAFRVAPSDALEAFRHPFASA
jgi:hypothetical protein